MLNSKKTIFFTNDVETTSLVNHCLSDEAGEKVLTEGLPALIEIYYKYNVKSTFFITGYIAQKFPEIVKLIHNNGHEVACHGYSHKSDQAFDVLSYDQQVAHLSKAKSILEDISGGEVISFRAPALRVNEFTPKALIETGFKIDSSIASQRGDMFLSFGSLKKLRWITAPRKSYFTKEDDLSKRGNSPLLEIPIPSYIIPYIGTFMRISPQLTSIIRFIAKSEAILFDKMPVFLIHPNEIITEIKDESKFTRRANNIVSYYLGDKLRHKLKLKNLGSPAIALFEDQVSYFSQRNFRMITLKEHYMNVIGGKNETNG